MEGYYVHRSGTNNVFVFLRAFYLNPKNLAPAVALVSALAFSSMAAQVGAIFKRTIVRRAPPLPGMALAVFP